MNALDVVGWTIMGITLTAVISVMIWGHFDTVRHESEMEDLMYNKFKYDNHEAFNKPPHMWEKGP